MPDDSFHRSTLTGCCPVPHVPPIYRRSPFFGTARGEREQHQQGPQADWEHWSSMCEKKAIYDPETRQSAGHVCLRPAALCVQDSSNVCAQSVKPSRGSLAVGRRPVPFGTSSSDTQARYVLCLCPVSFCGGSGALVSCRGPPEGRRASPFAWAVLAAAGALASTLRAAMDLGGLARAARFSGRYLVLVEVLASPPSPSLIPLKAGGVDRLRDGLDSPAATLRPLSLLSPPLQPGLGAFPSRVPLLGPTACRLTISLCQPDKTISSSAPTTRGPARARARAQSPEARPPPAFIINLLHGTYTPPGPPPLQSTPTHLHARPGASAPPPWPPSLSPPGCASAGLSRVLN
ncbi:hypothetical protein Purlil1_7191 [Purpureocillium lilacinum]|uniref:Berberine/berberine-like domain-containing protein n=1 Tax=Purpureocillium lilacinum TaxID=33203 RepID=A0ABR0BWD8_PURLI|nr:hypothetical protein Purlil1_7191 [Purpureocillium lilacinum]